jgi:hypothetical protein
MRLPYPYPVSSRPACCQKSVNLIIPREGSLKCGQSGTTLRVVKKNGCQTVIF